LAQIQHVNVRPKPYVVGEIPAIVVGIVVNDDFVAVPEPIAAVTNIKAGDAEIKTAKPEATGSSTDKSPTISCADMAREVSVLPGPVEMETWIIPALVVADPLPVMMNVRCFGMILLVAVGLAILGLTRLRLMRSVFMWRRTSSRHKSTTYPLTVAMILMLGERRKATHQ